MISDDFGPKHANRLFRTPVGAASARRLRAFNLKAFTPNTESEVDRFLMAFCEGWKRRGHEGTLDTLARLKTESEKLLTVTITGVDAAEARRRSRDLQDAIFGHRLSSSLVFEWIYNNLRPRLEARLVHGAEHWVNVYRKVVVPGASRLSTRGTSVCAAPVHSVIREIPLID